MRKRTGNIAGKWRQRGYQSRAMRDKWKNDDEVDITLTMVSDSNKQASQAKFRELRRRAGVPEPAPRPNGKANLREHFQRAWKLTEDEQACVDRAVTLEAKIREAMDRGVKPSSADLIELDTMNDQVLRAMVRKDNWVKRKEREARKKLEEQEAAASRERRIKAVQQTAQQAAPQVQAKEEWHVDTDFDISMSPTELAQRLLDTAGELEGRADLKDKQLREVKLGVARDDEGNLEQEPPQFRVRFTFVEDA